jgi:DNA-binding IclR family transcriptional regulator
MRHRRAACVNIADVASESASRTGSQAVERALAILRCFETGPGDLGVSEIGARVGLSVSTAHRLTRALTAGGLLTQDPRTERYQLGPALVVLGRKAEEQLGYASALPALESLAGDTGESVTLGIRSAADVLVVLHVASPQPLRFAQEPGTRVPVHASAMGKALLAFAEDPSREVKALGPLVGETDRTITDPSALADELDLIRDRGWAINDEERNVGVRAVAVPVLDRAGVAVAAVAVQGPTIRLPDDRVAALGARIAQANATIAPVLAASG